MDESQLEGALDRLDRALGKAETALERHRAAARDAAERAAGQAAQLVALEARHGQLKQSVADGLRQIDEILGGMAR